MNLELDFTYLNSICGGDEEFIQDILQTFMDEMPKDMQTMRDAVSQKDVVLAGKTGHKVKATLHLLGLEALKELAFTIEQAAKADSNDLSILLKAEELIRQMDLVYPKVEEKL